MEGDLLLLVPWGGLLCGEQAASGKPGNWAINAWLNAHAHLEKGAL